MDNPFPNAIPRPAAPRSRRPWKKWLIIIAALLLVVFALSRCGGKKEEAPAPKEQATRVEVITLAQQPIEDRLLVTGTLAARHELPISAELAGLRIAAVHVEEGDVVKKGQSLASLDTALLETELAQREAVQAQRVAEHREAQSYYQRLKPLKGSGAVSAQELDSREVAMLSAAANLKSAAAQVKETRTKLQQARIFAPAAGIIAQRTAEVGQLTGSGTEPLFRIVEKGEIELFAEVPESDLAKLAIDQKAYLWVGSERESAVEGAVRLIRPLVNAQTRLGLVRITVPKGAAAFRAGAFARAEVIVGARDALVVPLSAITYQDSRPVITKVKDDNKVDQHPITIGARQNETAEILKGAAVGDVVVSRAANFLRDGDTVIAVTPGEANTPVEGAAK